MPVGGPPTRFDLVGQMGGFVLSKMASAGDGFEAQRVHKPIQPVCRHLAFRNGHTHCCVGHFNRNHASVLLFFRQKASATAQRHGESLENPSRSARMNLTITLLCVYLFAMSTVAEIKAAIDQLSPRERCELEALRRRNAKGISRKAAIRFSLSLRLRVL